MPLVNRRSLAGLCAAGAIVLAAGCGGGGDGSNALSASEFRTQADAICQTSKDTIAALTEPTVASTNAQVSAFLAAGLKASDAQIAQLRALDPPSDLAPTVDQALDLLEQRQTRIRAVADRVAAGEDFTKVIAQENAQITSLNDRADAKATRAGPHGVRHGQQRLGHLGHDLDRNDGDRPHHDRRGDVRPGHERSQGGAGRPGGREHDPSGRERKLTERSEGGRPGRAEGADRLRRGRRQARRPTPRRTPPWRRCAPRWSPPGRR